MTDIWKCVVCGKITDTPHEHTLKEVLDQWKNNPEEFYNPPGKVKELPRPPCEECIYQSQSAEHDAKVAKAERKKALDEFMQAIEFRFDDTNRGRGVVGTIRGIKESLRSKP